MGRTRVIHPTPNASSVRAASADSCFPATSQWARATGTTCRRRIPRPSGIPAGRTRHRHSRIAPGQVPPAQGTNGRSSPPLRRSQVNSRPGRCRVCRRSSPPRTCLSTPHPNCSRRRHKTLPNTAHCPHQRGESLRRSLHHPHRHGHTGSGPRPVCAGRCSHRRTRADTANRRCSPPIYTVRLCTPRSHHRNPSFGCRAESSLRARVQPAPGRSLRTPPPPPWGHLR